MNNRRVAIKLYRRERIYPPRLLKLVVAGNGNQKINSEK